MMPVIYQSWIKRKGIIPTRFLSLSEILKEVLDTIKKKKTHRMVPFVTLERHVYHASKKLLGKELERGTILQKDPNDKTRFVVADRNEVFFDSSCVESLDDKLELLPDALAEDLLETISIEERLRFFNRDTRRVSHFH